MKCPNCNSEKTHKNGTRDGKQQYKCTACNCYFYDKGGIPTMKQPSRRNGEAPKRGIHKDALKAKYNVRLIIRNKVAQFKDDGIMLTRQEFIEECGIKGLSYAHILSDPEFDKYHGKLDNIDYWGHPIDIKDLFETTPMR